MAVAKRLPKKRPATQRRLVPVRETRDLTASQRESLQEVLGDMADIKGEIDNLQIEYSEKQDKAIALLQKLDLKSQDVILNGGLHVKGTLVQGERTVIDDMRLKKRLGAALWAKVTSTTLDRKKLEAAIKDGTVKASAVAECAELIPNKPFVKITTT